MTTKIRAFVAPSQFTEHEGHKILKWAKEGHFLIGLAIDPNDDEKVTALYVSNSESGATRLMWYFYPGETTLPSFSFSGANRTSAEEYLFWVLLLRYWDFLIELNIATDGHKVLWAPDAVEKRGPRGWRKS